MIVFFCQFSPVFCQIILSVNSLSLSCNKVINGNYTVSFIQVLLLAIAVLLAMKCVLSQECQAPSDAEMLRTLRKKGSGPLGAFNRNYMAVTQEEADQFQNLVWTTIGQVSIKKNKVQGTVEKRRKKRATGGISNDATYPITTLTGECETAGRLCSACPATTDLGPDIFPRYINEIVCESEGVLCSSDTGFSKNTILPQTFLYKTGVCDSNGKEIMSEFVQEIRVCCECFLF